MFNCESYFYSQKQKGRFENRRLRIIDENYTFGDRGTVTFRGKPDTDGGSTIGPRTTLVKRPSTGILRPGSSRGRQVTIGNTLPPVDPFGPHLVTEEDLGESEDIHRNSLTKKSKPAQSRRTDWNISEAKFASSSILSRLAKLLIRVSEGFEVTLPIELIEELNRQHEHLIEDTVISKRNWQTDCYQDISTNKQPFHIFAPTDLVEREKASNFLSRLVTKQQKEKRVQLKQKPILGKGMNRSQERPMTARSVMSNYSIKSDISQPSDDGRESRDYDLLPAELRPTILHYRRESATPKLKEVRTSTATRLERMRKLKMDPVSPRTKKKKTKFQTSESPEKTSAVVLFEEKSPGEHTSRTDKDGKVTMTIPFSFSNPPDEEWIVSLGDSTDPEANTLRMWEKQLKEIMRSREEEKMLAQQKGQDGPLFVKFYNNPQMRTLRTKGHQRSATFPMPAVFSKLPPSIASFSTPAPNDVLLIGEGLTVFVLTLPDGSGYCNYHSGRVAISMSRHNDISKGLYTLVFEDSELSPLIAYFSPSGNGCCYHRNGNLRMLYNKEGGSLYDEDGFVVRKWTWPTDGLNLAVTVNIPINGSMSLRCTSLENMTLRFSCRGQSHKISLSTADLDINGSVPDFSEGTMQSDVFFYSKTALDLCERPEDFNVRQPGPLKKGIKKKTKEVVPSEEDEGQDLAKPARELLSYKERIRSVVDDWMGHYRETIGIALPSRLASSKRRSSPDPLSSRDLSSSLSYGRQVKTSMGFYPEHGSGSRGSSRQHARSYTHPFPSPNISRAPSPLLPLAQDSPLSPAHRSRSTTALNHSRALSTPQEIVKSRSSPSEGLKPFKTGTSKPKPKLVKNFTGCPVGFRSTILKKLDSIPPCKCDKRHIPFISDTGFDVFLSSQVPPSQLVVIIVISSLLEGSCPCEPMLNALHCATNKHRFSPCNQCYGDQYRLFKYDVVCRAPWSGPPLLVERHHVIPGAILMYMGGKLLFADRVFNGYGTTKKDFLKQVQMCLASGCQGRFLPQDFKLSLKADRAHNRHAWAYPVSGVLQDLIPFSPESHSSSTSRYSLAAGSRLERTFTETSFPDTFSDNPLMESGFNSSSQSKVSVFDMSQAGSITSVVAT